MDELNISKKKVLTEKPLKNYEVIQDKLLEISSKLKHIQNRKEKIQLLIGLNDFLNENEEIIKNNFSDVLVSILNSL